MRVDGSAPRPFVPGVATGRASRVTATTSLPPLPGAPVSLSEVVRRHPRATRRLTATHAALVRATRGYVAARWFGAPILLLETTGRRSGRPHAAPLVYLADGDDLVVVPANAGADRAPAWWHNLRAAGEGVAVVDGLRRPVTPTVTEGARRDRLWRRFGAVSPVEHYQRQTIRPLPVVALVPLPAPAFHHVLPA